MPVKVKICGVRTRESWTRQSMPAPTISASCSFLRARAISSWRRPAARPGSARPHRVGCGHRRSRRRAYRPARHHGSPRSAPASRQRDAGPGRLDQGPLRLAVIKAIGVASADDVAKAAAIAACCRPDPVRRQGAGILPRHFLAARAGFRLGSAWPPLGRRPFALSGGLTPDNVGEAISITGARWSMSLPA